MTQPPHPPSNFCGVRCRPCGKYTAEIWHTDFGHRWLSTFDTAEEAAHDYDAIVIHFFGTRAMPHSSKLAPR